MNTNNPQDFLTTFFNKINNIVEKKNGGKRKNKFSNKAFIKRQKGGTIINELDLPIPLNDKNILDIIQLKKNIESNPSLLNSKINILPSLPINNNNNNNEIINEFTNQIKNSLENILNNPKDKINMSVYELQIFTLYLSYKNLSSDSKIASSIVEKLKVENQNISVNNMDENNNLELVEKLYTNIQITNNIDSNSNNNIIEKIENSLDIINTNIENDINNVSISYENNNSPTELSSTSLSSFSNLFGYLSFLFSLILCFKNKISSFNTTTFKSNNPLLYNILYYIQITIAKTLFAIGKLFLFIWNTRLGQIFLLIIFLKLYKENNTIAVFIANSIVQLISLIYKSTGLNDYVYVFMENTKNALINSLPSLLNNETVKALLTSSIVSALINPSVLANFMNNLSPEIIAASLPIIKEGLKETLLNASPEMVQMITQGIANKFGADFTIELAQSLAPTLIEGITTSVTGNVQNLITNYAAETATTMGTQAATTVIAEYTKTLANQQLQSSIINGMSTVALNYGAQAVSYFLTGDTTAANLITNNYGGKKTKKKSKRKKNKYTKTFRKRKNV